MDFVGHLKLSAAVKEFCKSIKNWHSHSHSLGGTLFWLTVYTLDRNSDKFSSNLFGLSSECVIKKISDKFQTRSKVRPRVLNNLPPLLDLALLLRRHRVGHIGQLPTTEPNPIRHMLDSNLPTHCVTGLTQPNPLPYTCISRLRNVSVPKPHDVTHGKPLHYVINFGKKSKPIQPNPIKSENVRPNPTQPID